MLGYRSSRQARQPASLAETDCNRQHAQQGHYLHLRGTPLFISDDKVVQNLKRNDYEQSFNKNYGAKRHLVLGRTEQKPELIAKSNVLAEYWKIFGQSLTESNHLILKDEHVNKALRS